MYVSTKTFGFDRGYAVAYRQWRAESHCRLLHGYALGFHFEFEADTLDVRNWVVDFGSLTLKHQLGDWFDHTTLVAEDDPEFQRFQELHNAGLIKMTVVEATGCEALSKFLFDYTTAWIKENGYAPRVRVRKVQVMEHSANSAWYEA